jgi:hypothetical protein
MPNIKNITFSAGKRRRKNRKAQGRRRSERIIAVSFENKPKVKPESGIQSEIRAA